MQKFCAEINCSSCPLRSSEITKENMGTAFPCPGHTKLLFLWVPSAVLSRSSAVKLLSSPEQGCSV